MSVRFRPFLRDASSRPASQRRELRSAGVLSDCMNRHTLLIAGLVLRIAADIVLALSGSVAGVALGVVVWGQHMGLISAC